MRVSFKETRESIEEVVSSLEEDDYLATFFREKVLKPHFSECKRREGRRPPCDAHRRWKRSPPGRRSKTLDPKPTGNAIWTFGQSVAFQNTQRSSQSQRDSVSTNLKTPPPSKSQIWSLSRCPRPRTRTRRPVSFPKKKNYLGFLFLLLFLRRNKKRRGIKATLARSVRVPFSKERLQRDPSREGSQRDPSL